MALKHAAKVETVETAPANVAPVEEATATQTAESAPVARDRMPWTAEKVRAVKQAVKESPGIALDDLLTKLRDGFLAEHLEGAAGRQRLINLIKGIRAAEEKATAAGTEFIPLPEVVMPETSQRPNLLEW